MPDRKTILIVDDDQHITFGVGRRLEAAGYLACCAADGQHALDMAHLCRPDLVLLDVRMPAMDGVTALRKLQASKVTRDIPVIMLSASLADQSEALEAGARFFVRKPYDRDKLLSAVDQAIKNPKQSSRKKGHVVRRSNRSRLPLNMSSLEIDNEHAARFDR